MRGRKCRCVCWQDHALLACFEFRNLPCPRVRRKMAVIASNESLTQTKLDPNIVFTPSSYPDNKSVIGAFKRAVSNKIVTRAWLTTTTTLGTNDT